MGYTPPAPLVTARWELLGPPCTSWDHPVLTPHPAVHAASYDATLGVHVRSPRLYFEKPPGWWSLCLSGSSKSVMFPQSRSGSVPISSPSTNGKIGCVSGNLPSTSFGTSLGVIPACYPTTIRCYRMCTSSHLSFKINSGMLRMSPSLRLVPVPADVPVLLSALRDVPNCSPLISASRE